MDVRKHRFKQAAFTHDVSQGVVTHEIKDVERQRALLGASLGITRLTGSSRGTGGAEATVFEDGMKRSGTSATSQTR